MADTYTENRVPLKQNNSGNAVPVTYGTDANGNPNARAVPAASSPVNAVPVVYGTDANGNPTARAAAQPAVVNPNAAQTAYNQVTTQQQQPATSDYPTWNYSAGSVGTSGYRPTQWDRQAVFEKGGLDAYNAASEARIESLYDRARENELAALKNAYDMNYATMQREQDQIAPQYQEARNQLAGQGEQARRNLNMQAAGNGINTGAGSQMQLAQNVAMQQAQARLTSDEQRAITESRQRLTDIQTKYQNDVAEAIANNDYQRAAALYDEYKEQFNRAAQVESYNMQIAFHQDSMKAQYAQMALQASIENAKLGLQSEQMKYQSERDAKNFETEQYWKNQTWENQLAQQAKDDYWKQTQWDQALKENDYQKQLDNAKFLAGFGDCSGYESIYGPDATRYMSQVWNYQNPALAYTLGNISADEYYKMTGKAAPGTTIAEPETTGSRGGGYGGSSGGSNPTTNPNAEIEYSELVNMIKDARKGNGTTPGMTDAEIRAAANEMGIYLPVKAMAESYDTPAKQAYTAATDSTLKTMSQNTPAKQSLIGIAYDYIDPKTGLPRTGIM